MKYATAALALAAGASAHSVMSEIFIDGEGQGSGTCIRTPNQAKGAVDPITDLSSKEMACGKDGTVGVARTCSMGGDQKLTFEWRQWPDDRSKQRFPYGHMGPCSVYMKKVDDATQDGATGDGWFKLWDDDLDYGSGKWCTQQMVENEGHMTVTIPNSLAGGDYLVRPELIALHNVPAKGYPEYYQQCAQIFLQSTGSSAPNETVSIPGHVSPQDPGNTYNPFEKPLKHYTIPGPAVASLSGTGEKMTDMQQKNGLKPKNTVVTNRNWSGVEIPSYTDEEGCWDSDKKCWDQVDKCYDTAGATGLEGCKTFQEYCKENQGNCKTGNSGPPNKGANWEPKHDTCSASPVLNAGMDYHASSSGSSSDSSSDKSPSDYTQKKGKAPSNDNQQEAAPSSEEAAPQYTQAPQQDSQPAPSSAAPTTMMTKASANPNVVYETDYATVVAYETVTDMAYATETAQAYRRHAHPRHAH